VNLERACLACVAFDPERADLDPHAREDAEFHGAGCKGQARRAGERFWRSLPRRRIQTLGRPAIRARAVRGAS
jgi:hypothetical protein